MFRGDTVELDQRKFDSLCDRTTGLRDVPNGRQTKQCNMYENTDSKSDLSSLYKTEPLNDEQTPLPVNKNSRKRDKVPTTKKPPSIDTPNEMNGSDKQLPTKATEWDSHAMTCPVMDSEIIIHRPRIEKNNSTSTETVIDSDSEIKPSNEQKDKPNENSKPEYENIFCVATIRRISPNTIKLIGISKIDHNIKVDVKSDGSSINGYAADHSSSSTNSIMCHEPFTVPKIPRDSFMSSSSSGSSFVPLNQLKSKPENILVEKNMYICIDDLICQKCNHVYPRVTDKVGLDSNHIKNNLPIKPQVNIKLSPKRKPRVSKINNKSNSKKTLKKKRESVKVKDLKNNSIMPKESIEEIPENNDTIKFDIGDKVLAYWTADKLFYPATIINIMPSKYRVKFMDGVDKLLAIENLVHIEALKQKSSIAVCDRVSQQYRVGEIVSINNVPNREIMYTVDLNSEIVIVPFDDIVLEIDSARKLQNKIVFKNYHRLSMSNVSEGKRLRSSRSTNAIEITKNTSTKRKSTQQGASEPKKKRKCLFPDKIDPRDIPSTSTGITEENYEMASQIVVSSDSEFDHIREDLTKVNMKKFKYSDIDSEHSSPDQVKHVIKSPIDKSIQVFKDLYFVLSYAAFKRTPTCNASDLSEDEMISNTQYFEPNKLHKKKLEATICKHGGHVFKYLNIIPKSHYKFTYLITDTPSQTCNYFLSLSLGIPSYHHNYIEEAISQNMSFPEYLTRNNIKPIPNGWSVEKKSIIFRSPSTVHREIFAGYIIFLALFEKPKNEFFSGILKFCGAIVYTSWNDDGPNALSTQHHTIIVTDEYCPTTLARSKLPKLSLNWVIQSLVCEFVRPYDGHESYTAINDDESVEGEI